MIYSIKNFHFLNLSLIGALFEAYKAFNVKIYIFGSQNVSLNLAPLTLMKMVHLTLQVCSYHLSWQISY